MFYGNTIFEENSLKVLKLSTQYCSTETCSKSVLAVIVLVAFHTILFYGNGLFPRNIFSVGLGFPHNIVLRKPSLTRLSRKQLNCLSTQYCSTETGIEDLKRKATEIGFFPHNIVLRKRSSNYFYMLSRRGFPHNIVLRKLGHLKWRLTIKGYFPHNIVLRKPEADALSPIPVFSPFHTILFYGNPYFLAMQSSTHNHFPHNIVLRKREDSKDD